MTAEKATGWPSAEATLSNDPLLLAGVNNKSTAVQLPMWEDTAPGKVPARGPRRRLQARVGQPTKPVLCNVCRRPEPRDLALHADCFHSRQRPASARARAAGESRREAVELSASSQHGAPSARRSDGRPHSFWLTELVERERSAR